MTTVGGGQQFVRVVYKHPTEREKEFCGREVHGCLSSTTTTPRLNQENDDDEEERNQMRAEDAATAATSSSSVTENKDVHNQSNRAEERAFGSVEVDRRHRKRTDREYSFGAATIHQLLPVLMIQSRRRRLCLETRIRWKLIERIARKIYERVRKFILDEELVIDEDHPLHESGLEGKWKANGITIIYCSIST